MSSCFRSMSATLVATLTLSLALSNPLLAAEIHFQSDTLLRGFQRDTTTTTDENVAPIYEYLQFDAGDLKNRGLSFHFYGWGRSDLTDSGHYPETTTGEVLYGYLQYTKPFSNLVARAGRQHIFEGVANESIDGLWVKSDLGERLSGSFYVGLPVGLNDDTNGIEGDSIIGGRLSHQVPSVYSAGISFKDISNDGNTAERMLGLDLAFYLSDSISLYGNSVYNLDAGGFSEHSYEARFSHKDVHYRVFAEMFDFEDYFDTGDNSVNPFRILAQVEDELFTVGADATWRRSDSWGYGGKLKLYYSDRSDASTYASVLTTWYGEGLTQIGGELGYLGAGGETNDFALIRVYGYWDQLSSALPVDFISTDFLFTLYDRKIFGEDTSVFVSLGTGQRFMNDALEIKISGDYSQDPMFDSDLRGLLTLTYNYARGL